MNKDLAIGIIGIIVIVVLVVVAISAAGGTCGRNNEPESMRVTVTVTRLTENTNPRMAYSYEAHFSDGTVTYVAAKNKCRYKVGTTVVYERNRETGGIRVWSATPPPLPAIDPVTAQYDNRTGEQLDWYMGMEECERTEWIRDQCRIMYAKGEISKEELDAYGKYIPRVEAILYNTSSWDLRDTPYTTIFDMPMVDVLRQAIERQRSFDR